MQLLFRRRLTRKAIKLGAGLHFKIFPGSAHQIVEFVSSCDLPGFDHVFQPFNARDHFPFLGMIDKIHHECQVLAVA